MELTYLKKKNEYMYFFVGHCSVHFYLFIHYLIFTLSNRIMQIYTQT